MITLLVAEPAVTFSIFKPILMTAILLVWGRWASMLDKDAEYYYLKRQMLNGMTIGAGVLAFGLWLAIPYFWIGLLLALVILIGAGVAYVMIRNRNVPEHEQWELNGQFLMDMIAQRRRDIAQREATLRFVQIGSKTSSNFKPVPMADEPEYPKHIAVEELLAGGLARNAQRIEVGITGKDSVIQYNIDGVSYKAEPMEGPAALAMVDYLKKETGLDVEDRRKKQTGEIKAEVGSHGLHDFRVTTAGSTRGLTCVIEIDPRRQLEISYDKIGLLESQRGALKPVLEDTTGVVVVAAPPKQGRTVTLYSLIQQHDPYMQDIHSLEAPPELDIEGVTQHEPGEDGWAKSLNSVVLKDPAVIMVAQTPDAATAKVAVDAAMDDKRLYMGINAGDTFAALKSWAKAVGDLDKLADSLRAVTAQRLIRKLCPTCRTAYSPDPAAMKKLNLPADKVGQLFKASGKVAQGNKSEPETCPTCRGIGYVGRAAAFEVMVIDDDAKSFLRSGDLSGLRSHLRKQKMLWMQEAALAKVVSGETSISEVMRALGEGGGKKAKEAKSE